MNNEFNMFGTHWNFGKKELKTMTALIECHFGKSVSIDMVVSDIMKNLDKKNHLVVVSKDWKGSSEKDKWDSNLLDAVSNISRALRAKGVDINNTPVSWRYKHPFWNGKDSSEFEIKKPYNINIRVVTDFDPKAMNKMVGGKHLKKMTIWDWDEFIHTNVIYFYHPTYTVFDKRARWHVGTRSMMKLFQPLIYINGCELSKMYLYEESESTESFRKELEKHRVEYNDTLSYVYHG